MEAKGIPYAKRDIFEYFGVSERSGYRMLKGRESRRKHQIHEMRGRHGLITGEQMAEMEKAPEMEGLTTRALTWEQLDLEANVEASGMTTQHAVGTMHYHKYIACKKGYTILQRLPTENDKPKAKNEERFHCFAAVGHNLKSDIYFYGIPSNTYGKITLGGYKNQILEPIVKPWLKAGEDFVLEEDGNSEHRTEKSNIVRK
ncbi:MAG: hypothetical protein Q9187_006628 [Circinaria calcarea]